MKLLTIIILVFLLIGAYIIITTNQYSLKEKDDTKGFLTKFGSWLIQLGRNFIDVTGYAVQKTWLPTVNETQNDKVVRLYKIR